MNRYVEVFLSYLLRPSRGHDSKAFYTLPAFASHPRQTITVTSPDCGPSPASLAAEYVHEGGGRIPGLAWTAPSHVEGEVKEWLIVSEDPDAPLPTPICHGAYGGIPASRRHVKAEDFEIADAARSLLKGGFHWGKGRREGVYVPPRPLMNHGPHRYFFEVVALSESLDKTVLEARATKEQVAEAIRGKVLGWGLWIGTCERRWS